MNEKIDLKDEIHELDKKQDSNFHTLDKKTDSKFAELKEFIKEAIEQSAKDTQNAIQQVDKKVDAVDEKVDAVDKKQESNFNTVDKKLDAVDKKQESNFNTVDKKLDVAVAKLDGKIDFNSSKTRAWILFWLLAGTLSIGGFALTIDGVMESIYNFFKGN